MTNPHNTFGKGHSTRAINGGLDAYFTAPDVATACIETLAPLLKRWKLGNALFIEPAAGSGVWLDALPANALAAAYDIAPQDPRVQQADFLTLTVPANSIVIGNPPFGFAAKDAIRFFNHAATGAAVIAFIVPRTFKKASVQARLHTNYHLEVCEDLPAYSFRVNGVPHDVPCCFQIWKRKAKKRSISLVSMDNPWLEFTTPGRADFAVRRVGGRAGQVLEGLDHSLSSTYFIRAKINPRELQLLIRRIDFAAINHTAGVRSLSKRELISAINDAMAEAA